MSEASPSRKPVILSFVRYYLPGYKGGGPVRSIQNLVERLGDAMEFHIVTMDRDLGDTAPYPGVLIDAWNQVGRAKVYYASPGSLSFAGMVRFIRRTPHDVLYLNSLFDAEFTLMPAVAWRLGLIGDAPAVIAPRGELSPGAFSLKWWKKKPYVRLAQLARVFDNMTWQASTQLEAAEIVSSLRVRRAPVVASDLVDLPSLTPPRALHRNNEAFRVLFLSRVSPKKNLEFVLQTLTRVRASVALSIVGPIEDEAYWQRCQAIIQRLPSHVSVTFDGHVEPARVPEIMAEHMLFFLPTRGENYGHVIAEALAAGTPVLISDTTPWRGLEQEGAGWDLPLSSEAAFAERIDECAAMTDEAYGQLRARVREYATRHLADPALVEANLHLFMDLVRRP